MKLIPVISLLEKVGGQAVLGRQDSLTTPWHTVRYGLEFKLIKKMFS